MLVSLHQGRRSVLDYGTEFQTSTAESGWNQLALVDALYNGLLDLVKDQLICLDLQTNVIVPEDDGFSTVSFEFTSYNEICIGISILNEQGKERGTNANWDNTINPTGTAEEKR